MVVADSHPKSTNRKRWLIALAVAFLAGFIPPTIVAYSRGSEVQSLEIQLQRAALKDAVAAATLHALRGDYERARTSASAFFTNLRAKLDARVLSPDQTRQLEPVMSNRDDVITLLARSDPAAVGRLTQIQHELRKALGEDAAAPKP